MLRAAGDHAGIGAQPRQSLLLRYRPAQTRRLCCSSAQADLDAIASRLEKQYPETNAGWGVTVYPIVADTVRMYATALSGY